MRGPFSRTNLLRTSRDRRVLLRVALVIGCIGLAVAVIVDQVRDKTPPLSAYAFLLGSSDRVELVVELGGALVRLTKEDPSGSKSSVGESQIYRQIQAWDEVDGDTRTLFNDFIGLCGNLPESSAGLEGRPLWDSLLRFRDAEPPHPNAHQLAAAVLLHVGASKESVAELRKGFEATGDVDLFHQSCQVAVTYGDHAAIREVLADPQLRGLLSYVERKDLAVQVRDYGELFLSSMLYQVELFRLDLFLLSLLACAVWFAILHQLGPGWKDWPLALGAVLLGVASAFLTLYVVFVQEDIRGFTTRGEFGNDLLVCVAGIGLREESIKLLCFLPLLPVLLRRGGRIEALILGACVGLGFALQENPLYLAMSSGIAWGRFLTATFLHMAATGIAAHAIYLLASSPKRNWENALIDILSVIVVHGLYDALLVIDELADYAILSILFIAYLAHRFFGLIQETRIERIRPLSPLAIFVLGSAVVLAVALNYSLWSVPMQRGISGFGMEVVPMLPAAFLFINYFKNS